MKLFKRLKADAGLAWPAYTEHAFVTQLGRGELPEDAFRHYLVQDYLFLIQFARAYALGVYKSPTLADMRMSLDGVKAILDVELDLHVELCTGWGMTRSELESAPEMTQTMAYTRFVLEAGMAGDLLDLQVALAPCIIGYAEIGAMLLDRHGTEMDGNPYRRWVEEYSGSAYHDLARAFGDWLDSTAEVYMTDARYPRLRAIFGKACALEADFWQMGLDYPDRTL